MTSTMQEHATVRWWPYAVGAVGAIAGLLTPIGFFVLLLILAVAIFRLTRRPPRTELVALIIAIALLTFGLAMFGVSALSILDLESTHTVRSTPLN